MKWDIGFASATDNGGTITSIPTISSDKKSITISCNIGTSTNSETCITEATIENNSTFNIMLSDIPTVVFDDTYIESVELKWKKSLNTPKKLDGIEINTSEKILITVTTKKINETNLPNKNLSFNIDITFNWIESDGTAQIIDYSIGQEITIGTEKFNVINTTKDSVIVLAQYNLDTNYRQSTTENLVSFSNTNGWEYTPGPIDIEINNYDGNAKTYINNYLTYLKSELNETNITGTLITLKEFEKLGCEIDENYTVNFELSLFGGNCNDSPYLSWLYNSQKWWTRSVHSMSAKYIWFVNITVFDYGYEYGYSYPLAGIRPVITIPKETLDSISEPKMISFYYYETLYQAEEGMSWEDWVNSPYNIDLMYIDTSSNTIMTQSSRCIGIDEKYVRKNETIKPNAIYSSSHVGGNN